MKVTTFGIESPYLALKKAGYTPKGFGDDITYILEDENGRFHASVKGKTIRLHYDFLDKGYHRVVFNASKLTKEKYRIYGK